MSNEIFEFIRARLKSPVYEAKRFRSLSALLERVTRGEMFSPHRTAPGRFSKQVSIRNVGETAFQRALHAQTSSHIYIDSKEELVVWHDIELPVTFSGKGRRKCVDLIGSTRASGCFLCELKYAKIGQCPPGNSPDYAIFEALIYFGIVDQNHAALDYHKVWRKDGASDFRWKDVASSKTLLVLANSRYWEPARREANSLRIHALVGDIAAELRINVLLYATPDPEFFNKSEVKDGKYLPRILQSAPWKPALPRPRG
jgi:hypothetical protein